MSKIVSSTVYITVDQAGNPRTEAWLTCEFGEAYQGDGGYAGGISFNLSPYFRRIEYIQTQPVSGSTLRDVVSGGTREFRSGQHVVAVPVMTDFGTPASSRFQLWGQSLPFISGSPMTSGFGLTQLVSGPTEAISGIRFVARAIGY